MKYIILLLSFMVFLGGMVIGSEQIVLGASYVSMMSGMFIFTDLLIGAKFF